MGSSTKNIAIFASGEGTNAQQLIDHFKGSDVKIVLIGCNNPKANVLKRAQQHGIPVIRIEKDSFYNGDAVLKKLLAEKVDLIVLAGFLWKVPDAILHTFPDKIINVHPALLPKFGGKGMYGINVHKAVIDAGEKKSGITIHYVNEHYDEGRVILQAACEVAPGDTPEMLARKVQELEHEYFPKTVEQLLKNKS